MDKNKKERIDALWIDSDYGQWLKLRAEEKEEEARALNEKVFNRGYWRGIYQLEEEISAKILNEISSLEEWDEYLKLLYAEHPDLVEFMVISEAFLDFWGVLFANRNNAKR